MRCAGISPRTLAVFCSSFRKVPLYLRPALHFGARPRAQLPADSLRPRPHTTDSAYRPLPGSRGPRGDCLKPTRLLRASPQSGGRQSSQNAREKKWASEALVVATPPTAPNESRDCKDLSPYLPRRLLSVRFAASEAGSRVTGWLGAGGPLGLRLEDPDLHLQSRCVGDVPLFSSARRAPPACGGLWVPAGVGAPPPQLFPASQTCAPRPALDSAPGSPPASYSRPRVGAQLPHPTACSRAGASRARAP